MKGDGFSVMDLHSLPESYLQLLYSDGEQSSDLDIRDNHLLEDTLPISDLEQLTDCLEHPVGIDIINYLDGKGNEQLDDLLSIDIINYLDGKGNEQLDDLLKELIVEQDESVDKPATKRARKRCNPALSLNHTGKSYSPDLAAIPCLPPPTGSPVNTLHHSAIHVVPAFLPPSALNFPIFPGAKVIIYTAPFTAAAQHCAPSTLPPSLPGIPAVPTNTSIPASPDRNCSSSPFAPNAVDLPSTPETASICQCPSSEPMDSFRDAQKKLYKEAFAQESDVLYTDVVLVNSRINPKSRKFVSKTAEKELINYDLDECKKEKVDLCNLFKNKEGKEMETKIIALLGQSGMGKTVLCKKICKEWSNGKFGQFSFVFYFDCSHLDVCKQYSFKDFLFQLSSCPQERNIYVYQNILRNPEKVLLIFNGFDEFQDSEGLLHSSFTTSPSKANKVKELFTGLFQKKLLRGCTLLITARPRDKFNQYLGKVDQITEVMGFSPSQVEWYIKEYFKEMPDFTNVVKWIKSYQYMFSYCYIPYMCKLMCLFAEANFKTGNKELPLSLASLFLDIVQKNDTPGTFLPCVKNSTVDLSPLGLRPDKELNCGLHIKQHACTGNSMKNVHSTNLKQSFLTACQMLENINVRNLVRYISLDLKKRRNHECCPDMVRRFLIGLLFHENTSPCSRYFKYIRKKQKKITEYFRSLLISELGPHQVLELLHCVHATNDQRLMCCLALTLNDKLSYVDTRLTPPDVYVLKHILKKSKVKISLDLRKTGVDQEGLRELVQLKSITSFRASLSDTVSLWKTLLAGDQDVLLKKCVGGFMIEPFKMESLKDITDLKALVDIQNDICNCSANSSAAIKEIPAVKNLKSVIFGLGKKHGEEGFLKLVEILPKLPTLQHLDLNNLTENHIGDKGVAKLAEKFPELQCIQTLDLSQNNITGTGAKKLAAALPSLHSLQTLSLYNNNVCDMGAELLADTLPNMTSLEALHLDCNRITDVGAGKLATSLQKCPRMKSLRMYNMTIPHAVLQHLQQQDSRISCLSIG
ncbi:MHC class II transactivator isoform X2 [Pseudophryne corroboree]|uniref:MHC class II transactivator isoform X2 n=1 Tax=Pseudophryne corroboree TaxID=495146 RepID=UPI003081C167